MRGKMDVTKDNKDVEIIIWTKFSIKDTFFFLIYLITNVCFDYIDTIMVLKRGLCDLF